MKNLLIVIGVGIALTVLFFAFNTYIYNEKQASTADVEFEPYRATLVGEYVCLPIHAGDVPGERECKAGIKTEVGEYYGIDFMLMSQTHTAYEEGDVLTASGVIVPMERLSADLWQKYPIQGIFSVTSIDEDKTERSYACDGDAKICPDGSAVGRQGPNCQFAACPSPDATSSVVTTYIDGRVTGMNITVNPTAVVSDSRCPDGVECVWEGTVEVQTVISSQVAHGEHTLSLNEPQRFDSYTVTLIEVTPEKTEADIPVSSYRMTYKIEKQ